jgi:two-component system NarL family sensor kinase
VLRMNLGKLGPAGESSAQQSKLHADTMELANHAVTEVRTISYLLHPPMLEDIGLEGAVRWYAEGFAKRSGLEMELKVEDSEERLPRELELAVFRTLQESLTNVHRHARATKVEIALERRDGRVLLSVRDNGKGLSQESLSRFRAGMAGGVGLAGMRERITEMGGTFDVESNENGTLLRATVPVELSSAALQEFGKLED